MTKIGLAILAGFLVVVTAFAASAGSGSKRHGFGGPLGLGPGNYQHKDPPVYNAPKRKTYKKRSTTKKRTPSKSSDTAKAAPAPVPEPKPEQRDYDIEHSSITSEGGDIQVSAQVDADDVATGSAVTPTTCKRYVAAIGETITVPCAGGD